jgi:cell division protein FtsB
MQGTVDYITQLVTATASDRGTVAPLNATNAKLAARLETYQAYIKKLKEDIANLKAKIKPA